MYGLRNVLDKQPVAISGAIMAWANLAVIAGWVHLDGKAISGLNVALMATLALFVGTKTANKSVLNELADAANARGEGGQSLIGVLVAVILIIVILRLLGVW